MLDPRREKFAQGVVSGLSLSEAYRRANQRALRWKPETVWENASRMAAESKVAARVSELKAEAAKQAILTRQEWLQRMLDVARDGEDQPSRLKALIELGRAEGYYAPTKTDHLNSDGTMRPSVIQIVPKL